MQATLALYRRYRPETFAEVIGQDHVTGPLRAALTGNRVHHAYLFSGPRGCGKTSSARILARCLNCAQGPTDTPCGECQSCTDLARGGPGSIDVIEIDAASHGGVDDARDLRERAFFAPVSSRYKVYIIDEAHMVTTQGFNALLKLVEEPPEHLKFIFATTEPDKVIGTIRSRTHHYPFRLIAPRTLTGYLRELCAKEEVEISPAALPLVIRAGGGSARDTLSVLDQLIGGAGPDGVTHELATGLLGFTPESLLDEVVDAFAADDGRTVFGVVDKVIETGQDPRRFTEDLLRRLRDLVIISAVPDAPATGLIDVAEDQGERLVAQAARFGRADLSRAADLVADGLTELKGATAPRLLLELICARVLLPGTDPDLRGVTARLDRLETRMRIEGVPSVVSTPAGAAAPAPSREQPPTPPGPSSAATSSAPISTAPATAPADTPSGSRPADDPADTADTETPITEAPTADAAIAEAPIGDALTGDAAAAGDDPAGSTAPAGGLGLVEVRRLWPDLLEAVKLKRRYTWILLSQNAQVAAVDDKTLTVALLNAGARNSFVGGGSEEILRQAAIDVVGHDWRIESIVDPSAEPGSARGGPVRTVRPAVREPVTDDASPAAHGASPPPSGQVTSRQQQPAVRSSAGEPPSAVEPPPTDPGATGRRRPAAEARGAILDTRGPGGPARPASKGADEYADRDDPEADDHGLDGAQLLARTLGASVIEEIEHD